MKFVLATITEQSGEEQYDSQFLVSLNVNWEFENFDFLLLNIYGVESISGFQSENRDWLELESSYRIVRLTNMSVVSGEDAQVLQNYFYFVTLEPEEIIAMQEAFQNIEVLQSHWAI